MKTPRPVRNPRPGRVSKATKLDAVMDAAADVVGTRGDACERCGECTVCTLRTALLRYLPFGHKLREVVR